MFLRNGAEHGRFGHKTSLLTLLGQEWRMAPAQKRWPRGIEATVVFERSRLGRVQDALARRDEWGACEARMPAEASMPADDRHAPLRRRRQRRRRRP